MKSRFLIYAILIFLIAGTNKLTAQTINRFSLVEAQEYAIEKAYSMQNARTDIKIAKKRVSEITALGLPQINADLSYTNFIDIPTQLIPGEFFGEPAGSFIPVQFGTKHNAMFEASLNQLIFDGSYLVGLKASRAFLSLSETQLLKSEIEVKESIAQAYSLVLVAEESKKIIDSTLITLEKSLYETREIYESGFIEDTDVDQLELLVAELEAAKIRLTRSLELAYNFLKYQMGMEISQVIILTDGLDVLLNMVEPDKLLNTQFDYNSNVDYRMLKNQEQLAHLQVKLEKAAYLPNIVSYLNFQENAQRVVFNFTHADQDWFKTSFFGFQMNIPIFSSGMRSSKVKQAKLKVDKLRVADQQLREGLELELITARADFYNAYLIYENKIKSLDIAKKIYRKTTEKYHEGISSSLDLTQSYNQFLDTESQYIESIRQLLGAKIKLNKILTKI